MKFLKQKISLMLGYTCNRWKMILILMKIVTQKSELIDNIYQTANLFHKLISE